MIAGAAALAAKALRTPPERCGTAICKRGPRGRLLPTPALERFAAKCRFDPVTGCVVWTAGTSSGQGGGAGVYGAFWAGGGRVPAHRWAAAHIHGFDIDGLQVDHYCPALLKPNTLCVEHVRPETQARNTELRDERAAIAARQTALQRQYWLFVSLGFEPEPNGPAPQADPAEGIPFYDPPEWLRPFMPELEIAECPF